MSLRRKSQFRRQKRRAKRSFRSSNRRRYRVLLPPATIKRSAATFYTSTYSNWKTVGGATWSFAQKLHTLTYNAAEKTETARSSSFVRIDPSMIRLRFHNDNAALGNVNWRIMVVKFFEQAQFATSAMKVQLNGSDMPLDYILSGIDESSDWVQVEQASYSRVEDRDDQTSFPRFKVYYDRIHRHNNNVPHSPVKTVNIPISRLSIRYPDDSDLATIHNNAVWLLILTDATPASGNRTFALKYEYKFFDGN